MSSEERSIGGSPTVGSLIVGTESPIVGRESPTVGRENPIEGRRHFPGKVIVGRRVGDQERGA